MMTTILAAFALSGAMGSKAKLDFAAQTDYGQALRQAAAEGKPMAVLIGTGNRFAKLMNDANLPAETTNLLRDKFVCVSVDVNTATGAKLAGEFQLSDGLVISSAGGTYQALRQEGAVSATDLAKQATAYATAGTPATTVTAGTPYTSGYTPAVTAPAYPVYGGCANGRCGVVAPAGYVAPSYPSYSPYPAFPAAGGCANGRCPTYR